MLSGVCYHQVRTDVFQPVRRLVSRIFAHQCVIKPSGILWTGDHKHSNSPSVSLLSSTIGWCNVSPNSMAYSQGRVVCCDTITELKSHEIYFSYPRQCKILRVFSHVNTSSRTRFSWSSLIRCQEANLSLLSRIPRTNSSLNKRSLAYDV